MNAEHPVMKIVAISGSQVPSSVANSLQTMKAVHALAQLGHEVTLIVPVSDPPHANWKELAQHYGLQKEFHVEHLPSASRRLFFMAAVSRAKSLKPDLLYVWPLQSAVLGLLNGLPVVLEMHDLPSGRVGPFWFRYFRDSKGQKRMTVITHALKQALTERYGAPVRHADVILAPNGVEPERFENLPDPSTARRLLGLPQSPTVVCAGHLYPGRGMELFVELAKKQRGVQFVWAGGKPEDVKLWKSKTEAISNILFTGFVHNSQLPMYQAAGDVLLMPYAREIGISSGSGHSAQISSPMKMFEYMATGRAIIASDLPVFHEVLNDNNAVFCPPEKVIAWNGALQALFDNPARREVLAAQAYADSRKYSWTERAKRILDGFPGSGR
jgi:glycosyltransferase involved in cell wall biosynthesis